MHNKKINILLSGLVVALSLTGCSASDDSKLEVDNTKEVEVSVGSIKEEISLSGSVTANKLTSVSCGEKSTVEEVYVTANEEVSEGEDIILLENGNVIEAPFDGKITKISVSEGDSVDSSSSVFNIADTSSFQIETSVDESEITKVSVGQSVDVVVSAINKEYEGKVTSVDAEGSSGGSSVYFGVEITLEGDVSDLYTGMSSEMNIVIKESNNALLVPVQAVKGRGGRYTVSVKSGDETKDVEVEVGLQNSTYAEILSGLKQGDIVVYTQATQSNNSSKGSFGGGEMPDFGGKNMPNFGGGEMPNFGGGERPSFSGGEIPSGMPSGGQGGGRPSN